LWCPMTTRKADLKLTPRLTAYVTREAGAAELQISPSTWDDMVERGLLPPPYKLGPNQDLPRWRWYEVEQRIVGNDKTAGDQTPFFRGLANGTTTKGGRDAAA
jgi:predicted DNA-binding transcriptional regulator AlpA